MTNDILKARLELFPVTTSVVGDGASARLEIAGCALSALAEEYGTPLYLYDQRTMDVAADAYRLALARHYPAPSGVTYAGKAFLCMAAARWVHDQGFWLDCTGAGELYIATVAGFDPARLLVHGVNKSSADLAAAVTHAQVIVVDNLNELEQLTALLAGKTGDRPELWLRIRPGIAVDTHAHRQTGQLESKFGMSADEAVEAVQLCRRYGLALSGLHFHQGSHFHDPAPIGPALDTVLDLAVLVREQTGWTPRTICPGGGWGVAYHEDDLPHPSIEAYVAFVAQRLVAGCNRRGLPAPRLQLEPGRSLVARAGVALYRVGAVKEAQNRRWVLLDGGMADNPRPALYGARYSGLPVDAPLRPIRGPAWFGGPYCESGDVLMHGLPWPDVQPGEVIAVPVSGAYHLAMGSNYNGARKPAVLWLRGGKATLIQRRETLDELIARDQLVLY